MKIKILILLIVSLFNYSCYQKHSYLFYNKSFYTINNKNKKLYKTIKKNLKRNFFKVNQKQIKSFGQIKKDIKLMTQKYPPGLLVLENFISPLVLKKEITINKKGFKLLTYDINKNDFHNQPPIPTFNITIDNKILNDKIIKLLKKYSKKNNLSDCAIITNADYSKCKNLKQYLLDNKFAPLSLDVYDDEEQKIKDWLKQKLKQNKKSIKCVVFFSFSSNKVLLNEELKITGIPYIEIITNYSKLVPQVAYNVNINWNKCFTYALKSKFFKNFIKKNKFKKKDNIFMNFIIKYDNVIEVRKNLFPMNIKKNIENKKEIKK